MGATCDNAAGTQVANDGGGVVEGGGGVVTIKWNYMTNANDCAYPADSKTQTDGGLTKREYFAAMAMQGILSNNSIGRAEHITIRAVQLADSLIEQLNRTP